MKSLPEIVNNTLAILPGRIPSITDFFLVKNRILHKTKHQAIKYKHSKLFYFVFIRYYI